MTVPLSLRTGFLQDMLDRAKNPSNGEIAAIIEKARKKKGLALADVARLVHVTDTALTERLFRAASEVKREIYGRRLVLFAPLYVSDHCVNECCYCNFRSANRSMSRRKLTLAEVERETRFLIGQGHKRILLEAGEDPSRNTIDYIVSVIKRIYSVKVPKGNIRRVNVNIAATTPENYRKLKEAGIGTYQLFQETYHRPTYESLHTGPKADYERQLGAPGRAFEGGIDDVGLGVLFGLYDWRFELLGLAAHARNLEAVHNVGPHTISVPRLREAPSVSYKPAHPVSDADFLKLIAILRLAMPYAGIILSTRESPEIRRRAFDIGVSQASAGSVPVTGGYCSGARQPQFDIHDARPLREVVRAAAESDLIPSFCTACYRSGRTGERFMELSKPGHIHKFCDLNAALTFAEYLSDFGDAGLRRKGRELIRRCVGGIENLALREEAGRRLAQIARGRRDLYF